MTNPPVYEQRTLITRYDDRMVEEVSSIRAQSSLLLDQSEGDLRLSDDAIIRLAGNEEDKE
jgi:hypothetical protein